MADSRHHAALALGIYSTLALDLFGSVTSSPQTTELFARDREGTLLKYVYIADAGGLAIGAGASLIDGTPWPFLGALMVTIPMHCLYKHAARVGKSSPPPMTPSQKNGGGAPVSSEPGTGYAPVRQRGFG